MVTVWTHEDIVQVGIVQVGIEYELVKHWRLNEGLNNLEFQ